MQDQPYRMATDRKTGLRWKVYSDGRRVFAGAEEAVGQSDPMQGPQVRGAELDNEMTAEELADWRATRDERRRKAAAEARSAQAQAQIDERQASNPDAGLPAAEIERRQKEQDKKQRGETIRRLMGRVRTLYNQDIQGQPVTRGFGLTEHLSFLPANERFNQAANNLLPLIRPLVAQSAREGDSDKEMEIFMSYVPQAGDNDKTIEQKLQNLELLIGGLVDGDAPSATLRSFPRLRDQYGGPPNLIGQDDEKRFEPDPETAAAVDQMIYAQVPNEDIFRFLTEQGNDVLPTEEQLNAAKQYARDNPGYNEGFTKAKKATPTTEYQRDMSSVAGGDGLGADLYTAGTTYTNAALFGGLDEIAGLAGGDTDQANASMDFLRHQSPGAAFAGDLAGNVTGMLGIQGAGRLAGGRIGHALTSRGGVGGDVAYGTLYGGGEHNENRGMGALTGSAAALGGNFVGQKVANGIGRPLRGVSDGFVQRLHNQGVDMTPGQVVSQSGKLGAGFRAVEDTLGSVPFLGAAVRQGQRESLEGFDRAAFREGLAPINRATDKIGEEGIEEAQGLVSQSYGDALNGVTLQADEPFIRGIAARQQAGGQIPKMGEDFNYILSNEIGPLFGQAGELSGKGFQEALQVSRRAASDFSKQGLPTSHAASQQMRGVSDDFIDMAMRQAPEAPEALNSANAAHRNISVLENASLRGSDDLFTPYQLRMAAKQNTKKYGGQSKAARGDMPYSDLAEAGQAVLPPTIPNSGTADRAWSTMVLPAALGGSALGAEALGAGPGTVGTLAALGGLYTRPGSRAFQKLMLDRPEIIRGLGEDFMRLRRPAGMFGSAAAIPIAGTTINN